MEIRHRKLGEYDLYYGDELDTGADRELKSITYNPKHATYDHKTGRGVKGKEILAHELSHLKDKKVYSEPPTREETRKAETRADIGMIKTLNYGSADYRRMVKGIRRRDYKDMLDNSDFQQLSDAEQRKEKKRVLLDNPHVEARSRLIKKWDKYRRLGLKENLSMSYIQYIMEACCGKCLKCTCNKQDEDLAIDEVSAKQKNAYLLRKLTNRLLKKQAHLARFQAVPTPQPVQWQ